MSLTAFISDLKLCVTVVNIRSAVTGPDLSRAL